MIVLAHGAGGRLTHELVRKHFLPLFKNPALEPMLDSAVMGNLAFTTDSYVVTPRTFPGGDIGRLAVSGTVNDLCMVGAVPQGLSAAIILEEGFSLAELDTICRSMATAANEAGVFIVTGDTKVVPRGACDGMFINTSGIGQIDGTFRPSPERIAVGDAVLISGTIADHGMTIMACREGLRLQGDLASDVAPLAGLVAALRGSGLSVHALRDPTRGGVCQSLIELAQASQKRIVLSERTLPIRPAVRSACELLGVDPLNVANEGKLVAFVPEEQAEQAVACMREHPLGTHAAIIGRVEAGAVGCELETRLGSLRRLRMAAGELLPRIC